MSINLNPNLNLNPTSFLSMDSVSNTVNSSVNAAQSGIMQSLSQLLNTLSQLLSSGMQNCQFNPNSMSSHLGNSLGNSLSNGMGNLSLSGLQNPQLGGSPINISLGNGNGQSFSPAEQNRQLDRSPININLGNGNGQSFSPAVQNPQFGGSPITINIETNPGRDQFGQPQVVSSSGNCQAQQPMSTERAAQVLNQSFDKLSGGAETFGRDDLQRVANDPSSSPELRQAARFVLNNPQAMSALDTADTRCNAAADGRISKGDLTAAGGAVQSQPPMNADRAAQVLNQNFDNVSGGKETVNRDDLRRALTDPNSSPEVKSAANFLLNNPDAFRKIETADQRSQGSGGLSAVVGDGRISKGDTVASMALSNTQTQPERNAVAALLANKDSLMAGGDKLISKDELGMIATTGKLPNGQPAPADLQQAAKYFTENPAMFSKLEDTNFYRSSNNNNIPKGDGKVGLQDMLTALSQ